PVGGGRRPAVHVDVLSVRPRAPSFKRAREVRMSRQGWSIAFLFSVAVFIAIAVKLFRAPAPAAEEPMLVYCAAGLRQPVEAAVTSYGGRVQVQFGGSNTLLANAEVSRK